MPVLACGKRRSNGGGPHPAYLAFCALAPGSVFPSMHTFLWHDYETFGANTRRDRPAQFAGIRTDAELNEIGEPLML